MTSTSILSMKVDVSKRSYQN